MSLEQDERKDRLFWGASFLITFVLWMIESWPSVHGVGDFLASAIVSVLASVFTFWIVAIGLLILSVPVRILMRLVTDLRKK